MVGGLGPTASSYLPLPRGYAN